MKIEKDYPGLCKEFTAAGTPRWRVRVAGKKGKKITLPGGMDDKHPEFDEALCGGSDRRDICPDLEKAA